MAQRKRKIKFHFFDNPGIGGWLIKYRNSSIFSHVGIEFEDGQLYQSTIMHGNTASTLAEYGCKPVYTTEILVGESGYVAAKAVAEDAVGRAYDYKGILGFLMVKKVQTDGAYFCSELGRYIFEAATGVRIPLFTLVSPGQLRMMVDTYHLTRALSHNN